MSPENCEGPSTQGIMSVDAPNTVIPVDSSSESKIIKRKGTRREPAPENRLALTEQQRGNVYEHFSLFAAALSNNK